MVSVAGKSMVLNSTNVEFVIATIIEEANKGEIDLNGFSSFWTFTKQQIYSSLRSIKTELEPSELNCEFVEGENYKCSACVCQYRNFIIEETVDQVVEILEYTKSQCMNLYDIDLTPYINDFVKDELIPWSEKNSCASTSVSRVIKILIWAYKINIIFQCS